MEHQERLISEIDAAFDVIDAAIDDYSLVDALVEELLVSLGEDKDDMEMD